jgi:hypothetical protein
MGLLSQFNKPDETPIHSSGLAAANDGSAQALGAMRSESFEQRMAREHNRQHIGSYRYASITQRQQQPSLRKEQTARPGQQTPEASRPSRQERNAQVISRPSTSNANFAKPPTKYNPYS